MRNFARKTRRKADKPLRVLLQKFQIYPRLIVETLRVSQGIELYKVVISFVVLGDKQQVVALPVVHVHIRAGVKFTADNGLYAVVFRLFLKRVGGEHIAVVGDGHGAHTLVPHRVQKGGFFARNKARRPVEQRIFRMHVQVDETFHLIGRGREFGLFFLFLFFRLALCGFFRRLFRSCGLLILFFFRFRHVTFPFALLFLSPFPAFLSPWTCSRPIVLQDTPPIPSCVPAARAR